MDITKRLGNWRKTQKASVLHQRTQAFESLLGPAADSVATGGADGSVQQGRVQEGLPAAAGRNCGGGDQGRGHGQRTRGHFRLKRMD